MTRGEPLYPEVGVLVLVDDQWNGLWQPRHHIVSRLARYFHVLWVEPAAGWREHLGGRAAEPSEASDTPASFHVLAARDSVPRFYRPRWLSEATLKWRWRHGARKLRRMGCSRLVVYVWRPHFDAALEAIQPDLSCYHIDDEYSWSDIDLPMHPDERSLIARVDRVFIHSPELMQKKGWINPRTTCVPNGVDFDAYSRPVREPADLTGIPSPRIGYTGFVKRQLDFDLLDTLADRHPEWSFVFVGVHRTNEVAEGVARLRQRPNVHFLGAKSVTELAHYPQHFDVCIMPYRVTDYTKYIYPMKLHEYLASGRPVVGTGIPSLVEFADCVRLVSTLEEWETALSESLKPEANTQTQRRHRQAVARRHDWDRLAATVAQAMAADLHLEFEVQEAEAAPALAGPLERTAGERFN